MVPFLSRLFDSHYDSLEFNEISKKAVCYVVEHTLNYSRCWCCWENDIHKLLENLTAPNTKWHVYFWCNWDTFPEVCNPQQTFVCVLSLCVCCFLLIYFQIDFFFWMQDIIIWVCYMQVLNWAFVVVDVVILPFRYDKYRLSPINILVNKLNSQTISIPVENFVN